MNDVPDYFLKNAVDSIQIGFEDYFLIDQDNRRIVSSIRNLHAGILLFLKWIIKKRTPGNTDALIIKNHTLQIDGENILAIAHGSKTIGRDEIIDRLKIVGISLEDNQKLLLNKIGTIRNHIEHHFSNHPKQELEKSILAAFWFLKIFKENYYIATSNQDFFGPVLYGKLISLEEHYGKQKALCYEKWVELDFNRIQARLPGKIFDADFNKYHLDLEKIIRSKHIIAQAEIDLYEVAILFFSSISCPNCKSELVKPIGHDFSSKMIIKVQCTTCDDIFMLEDVIENYLEEYYAYEIMKAGAKGGIFALGRCPSCKLGTFLNFDDICIYCGNINPYPEDLDFESELASRNVDLSSDKW